MLANKMRKLTQEEVIARFNKKQLEVLELYKHAYVAILTKCVECHHEWRVTPAIVFKGSGCPKCARAKKPLSQSEVVTRFNLQGLQMLEPYKNRCTSILTCCRECNHKWHASPGSVFEGCGCPKCASSKKRLLQSEIIARFDVQGLQMLEPYENNCTPVLTCCRKCDYEWHVRPNNVFNGMGCPKCARIKIAKLKTLTQDRVSARFDSEGLEMLEPYSKSSVVILVRCKVCSHESRVRPSDVFCGSGCPKCRPRGFQTNRSATLYYVRICNPFGEPVYKIGITNRTIRKRFGGEFYKITVVETWHFINGAEAFEMEQDILNDYDADRYEGPDILEAGNDELFTLDVLGLDKGTGQLELVA